MANLTLVIGNKNYSSWSLRPWLAMKQAGLEFEEIRIPLYQVKSRRRILQYSPTGKVPVLIHGDVAIWESLAICDYLAEQFSDRHWLPDSNPARAIARAISAEMHAGFEALRRYMPMDFRARLPGHGMKPGVQDDINRIRDIWRTCREQYGLDGEFLFGVFTIADAMFAPVVSRFMTYCVELDAVSQAYADAIGSLPAMQEWQAAAADETEYIPVQNVD
ncbi:MAG: glutathione S-transferase family protein [Elainellaceae cyanobacterium]